MRAELLRQVGLRAEARDHAHLDVGIERPQDRDRARSERSGAVHEHLPARRRGVARDGVQRHRERVGEHRDLVGHVVGHGEQHRRVRGHERRPAPLASFDVPTWIPGAMGGVWKFQQRLRSPAAHAGQIGETPRGTHDNQGFSTTRSPTATPSAAGPSATTSATTSWPGTWGIDEKSRIGLSAPPSPQSMNTCLASEPQMPVSSGAGHHPVGEEERRDRAARPGPWACARARRGAGCRCRPDRRRAAAMPKRSARIASCSRPRGDRARRRSVPQAVERMRTALPVAFDLHRGVEEHRRAEERLELLAASVPACLMTWPPLPITMPFCESRSTSTFTS